MKKKDWFYIGAIGAVVICIAAVIVYKFVLPGKNQLGGFAVRDFEKITVMDLSGNKLQLSDLVSKDSSTYCFLFELTGCYSCISRGIADLKQLKAAGKSCIAVAVHHLVDEVAGWSANQDFAPFFMLEKPDFYEYIHTPVMPVMIKIKNGKVESFRYIRPQVNSTGHGRK